MQPMDKNYGVFGDVLAAGMIGSWKIEVDEGREPRMYGDATMMRLLGLEENADLSPEAFYHAWYDHVDPAHYDAVAEGVGYMAKGQHAEIQYPWHHPDGRTIIVRCGGVRDDGYSGGTRVVGIHQWVTYLKHVDRELEEQQRQLEKNLETIKMLSKVAEQCISVFDVDLRTGLYEIVKHPDTTSVMDREDRRWDLALGRDFAAECLDETRETIEKIGSVDFLRAELEGVDHREFTYRHRQRVCDSVYRRCTIIALERDVAGNAIRALVDFMAVDDAAVRMRQQLEEMHAIERANKAKSYFFSTVSHDIRTPLNAIIGYAELLKLGIADESEHKVAVDSLLVSGHALLELINDVLDLSKLEAGKMEICPEPVDVVRLVEEVAKAFRVSIGNKSLVIRTQVQPMPWLKLDPHRVRQILFNLVGNAVKFTEKGFVEIVADYDYGTFRCRVHDTGCGISEEDQQRIAQPYIQVGSILNRGKGTGLGLAICKQLVARMGGEIELESTLGKGTTFTVVIPGIEEEDETAHKARLSTTQRIRIAVKEKVAAYRRVLVVDDQPMNRTVLKIMLARFGIPDVVTAENGVDALKKLAELKDVDLVLTDMWMPELDGEGLVGKIRRTPALAKLPVYAVTADVEAQKDYTALGFTGILLKPITLSKLKDVLG